MATCDDYRIDVAAASFGQCKCGAAKNAHKVAEVLSSRATSFSPRRLQTAGFGTAGVPKGSNEPPPACDDYKLDMTASRFGRHALPPEIEIDCSTHLISNLMPTCLQVIASAVSLRLLI